MYNDNEEIGEKIRYYRKLKGFTQKELAAKIGKTESSVQKYEKGLVTIPLDVLEKIAVALEITAFELSSAFKKYSFMGIIEREEKENDCLFSFLRSMGYIITEKEVKPICGNYEKSILTTIKDSDCDSNGAITLDKTGLSKFIDDIKDYIHFKFWQCQKDGFVTFDDFVKIEKVDKKGAD